jgi:hypothetical protein
MFNIHSQLPSSGDNIVIRHGEVISIEDPYRMFRAQVRVFGMTDNKAGIPDSELPWYTSSFPVSSASIAGAGHSSALEAGSKVFVMILDYPHCQHGVILSTHYPGPSSPSHISPLAKGLKDKGPKLPMGDNNQPIDLGFFGNLGIKDIVNNLEQKFGELLKDAQIFQNLINMFKKL